MPDKTPSPRPSDKGLNNEELERLQHICTSHQEPAVRKRKLTSDEKFLKCKDFMDLRESEELRGSAATSCSSDGDTHLGTDPRRAKQQANVKMTESSPRSGKVDNLTEAASPGVAAGKAHMEEQRPCAESIREGDTQFTEAVGRPCSDCLCAGDARKADHCLQPGATQPGEDGAEVTRAISAEPKEDDPEEPMVDRLLLTDLEHAVPDLNAKGVLRAEGNCDDSVAAAESQLGNIVLGLLQPPGLGDGKEGGSVQGGTDASTCSTAPDENTVKTTENTRALPSSICREETHEEMQNEATEDFFIYLLNGSLKDSGDLLTNLEQSDFDTQTDEEASYSPGEAALEDSPVSLDELAKRIEVEEIIPAEGLVSILKKRNDGEEKNVVEIQQKQTKRRVRFQEMDDALDQDEVAGGSCLLLILLCVVTVFISVGGTALYCSFGDMESPVCTDFASNMDLYYTQVLQGLEEVKHWVFPS
ncbi:consortin-like [Rhinatrema bivittatum]|uniref:consortin-like n=1 Tax=Rhinatrema bivittatum TaxID=194408 RepID=UPI00112E0531|nr:consortin-like [Rhinatrema bivittatum]